MTKVQVSYDLVRPLGDSDLEAVARAHGVYGIVRVQLKQPAMDSVNVEFDASRLMPNDVESALLRVGIPIKRT